MRQVRIDTLLEPPQDGASYQREWTTRGQCGERALLLELAFFAGTVGPGLFAVAAMCGFYAGMLTGLLIVVVGYGLGHMAFLGRMERSWRSILRPGRSWLSRGSLFAGAFMALAALAVALHPNSPGYPVVVTATCVAAGLLAIYPGFLFSVLRAIPFWNSIVLIPLFLLQALGGGVAMVLLLDGLGAGAPAIRTLLVAEPPILVATAALMLAHLFFRRRAGSTGQLATDKLLRGAYRGLFLLGAVLCGLALPLVLTSLALLGEVRSVLVVPAALGQLSGIVLFKYCLLNAGLYSPLYDPRLARPAK